MMYADDTKLWFSHHRDEENLLQFDLDYVRNWLTKWQLRINIEKCCVIHLGRGNPRPAYFLDDQTVSNVKTQSDLGVVVSDDMKHSAHCAHVASKASQRLGLIFRCFKTRDPDFLIRLYKIYVRPILEYNSPVWSPYLLQDIDKIENVQRSFLRRLRGYEELSYSDRLRLASLDSLELRRVKFDLYLIFKIKNRICDIKFDELFELTGGSRTRGHHIKLRKNLCNSNAFLFSFCNRVVDFWNALPRSVVEENNYKKFKTQIHLHNQILSPFTKGRTL